MVAGLPGQPGCASFHDCPAGQTVLDHRARERQFIQGQGVQNRRTDGSERIASARSRNADPPIGDALVYVLEVSMAVDPPGP